MSASIIKALHQVSIELIQKGLQEEEILTVVGKTIQNVLHFDRYRLYLYDEKKRIVRQVKEGGMEFPSKYTGEGRLPDGIMEELIRRGDRGQRSLHITHLQDAQAYPFINQSALREDIEKFGKGKVQEVFYLILISGPSVIGMISINNWEKGTPLFSGKQEEEIEALETFGSQAATAIDSLRNHKLMIQKTIQSEKLAALSMLTFSLVHKINNPLTAILFNSEIIKDLLHKSETILPTLQNEEKENLHHLYQTVQERIEHIVGQSRLTSTLIQKLARVVEEAEHVLEEEPEGSKKVLDIEAMLEKIIDSLDASLEPHDRK